MSYSLRDFNVYFKLDIMQVLGLKKRYILCMSMSITITGSRPPCLSWQEEKHNDRRPTKRNVSMEVSPSKGTVKIGPPRKNLSISAEYNNNRDFPHLSTATLFYERDFSDKYARLKVLGGVHSLDSSKKNYENFLGGTVDSKLGTFTGEIHSGDQYWLGYSTEGTWIGDLPAQQLGFTLTKSGEAFTYSGRFKIGPIANLPNNVSLSTEVSLKDNDMLNPNIITTLNWHINNKFFIALENSKDNPFQFTVDFSTTF